MRFGIERGIVTVCAVMAAAAIGACASSSQYASNSAPGTVDLAAYPIPPLPANEVGRLRGMSDEDILGHMALVDSIEMATSDSAIRLLKGDQLLSYARMMRASHSTDLLQVRDIAQRTGIPAVEQQGGLRKSHIVAQLDSLPQASDLTMEHHYVMSQIALHQHVLRELEVLQDVAQNDAVRHHVDALTPVVRDHLARAHALAVERGYEKKRA